MKIQELENLAEQIQKLSVALEKMVSSATSDIQNLPEGEVKDFLAQSMPQLVAGTMSVQDFEAKLKKIQLKENGNNV